VKTTALLFPTNETLFAFIDLTKAIHLSIAPRARLVRGLFTADELTIANARFGASILYNEFVPDTSQNAEL